MTWLLNCYLNNQGLKHSLFYSFLYFLNRLLPTPDYFPENALYIYHSLSIPTGSTLIQGLITLHLGFCFFASSLFFLHLNVYLTTRLIFQNTPALRIPCSEISEGFLLLEKAEPECLNWQWREPASCSDITIDYHHFKAQLKSHLLTNPSIISLD